jgi:hypothetical protein
MRLTLLSIATLVASVAFAQSVTIKKVELAGELVIVHYELDDSNPNNEYLINLYSSKDNYFAALTKVTGDVGMEVKPGVDKKIQWKIRDEYGPYKGKIALEIRGKVYIPFVKLTNFDAKKGFKKGKSYDLKWKPGASNPINIEIYKGGERVAGDINLPNNGSHTLFFQKHLKNGKDYRLKITDTKNADEVLYTENFKVAPKIPMVAKIAVGAVVVGGLVFVLTQGGGGGKNDNPPNNTGDEIGLPKLPGDN